MPPWLVYSGVVCLAAFILTTLVVRHLPSSPKKMRKLAKKIYVQACRLDEESLRILVPLDSQTIHVRLSVEESGDERVVYIYRIDWSACINPSCKEVEGSIRYYRIHAGGVIKYTTNKNGHEFTTRYLLALWWWRKAPLTARRLENIRAALCGEEEYSPRKVRKRLRDIKTQAPLH